MRMGQPKFETRVMLLMTDTELPRQKAEEIVAEEIKEERRLQVAKWQAEDAREAQTEKPLYTRERDTLLTIIAALAKEAKINIHTPGSAALSIEDLTDKLGAHVSKRAIENHLKKIPDAVGTRKK